MIKFKNICKNLNNLFVTSDLHGYHKNLTSGVSSWDDISKCRKFDTVDLMNQTIIDNINKYVKEDDVLIHCGDWTFAGQDKIKLFRNQINCKNIYGIEGNHDVPSNELIFKEIFTEYKQLGYYSCEEIQLFCSHYPQWGWHGCNKGVISLHGHCHSDENDLLKEIHKYNSIDVGIDNAFKLFGEYRPFKIKEILSILENNKSKLSKHHDS
jgi:calcineurin-like phosphoesterase family protein